MRQTGELLMKAEPRITYKDLFELAQHETEEPGSALGAQLRNGVETVNAAAKTGVALIVVTTVVGAGRAAGFAQGFWRGVAALPKA
jgi:hypothetical protein